MEIHTISGSYTYPSYGDMQQRFIELKREPNLLSAAQQNEYVSINNYLFGTDKASIKETDKAFVIEQYNYTSYEAMNDRYRLLFAKGWRNMSDAEAKEFVAINKSLTSYDAAIPVNHSSKAWWDGVHEMD